MHYSRLASKETQNSQKCNQREGSLISIQVSSSQDVERNSPTNDSNNMQSRNHRFKKKNFLKPIQYGQGTTESI